MYAGQGIYLYLNCKFFFFSYFIHTPQSVVRYLAARGWRIVGAQVHVRDAKKRRRTAIDLLCRDKEQAFVVVEVKTRTVSLARHQEAYAQVDANAPVTALRTPNSLYWRHMSQLRQTVDMFRLQKRAQKQTVKGVVLVTLQGVCLPYPLR